MKVRLGYVAVPITLEHSTYCKTMTYTQYCKLGEADGILRLHAILEENLDMFLRILDYNIHYDILFYRMSHSLVPLATHEKVHFDYLSSFLDKWQEIGSKIKKYHMRVDMHPDQYCVLNSVHPEVVQKSIHTLAFHFSLFQAMGIDGKVILHVGGAGEGKEAAILRFKQTFQTLDDSFKRMILLENDDKVFTILDVLSICEELKIPMVLDYHHYLCHHGKEKIEDYLMRIFATWEGTGLSPKVHFSSPKSSKEKRSHSVYLSYKDFYKFLQKVAVYPYDIDVMLECKGKDEALFRLVRQLKFYYGILFLDGTTFLL